MGDRSSFLYTTGKLRRLCGWLPLGRSVPCGHAGALRANAVGAHKWYHVSLADKELPSFSAESLDAESFATDSLVRGDGVIVMPNILTDEECQALTDAGTSAVQKYSLGSGLPIPGLTRLPAMAVGTRVEPTSERRSGRYEPIPALTALDDTLCDALITRILLRLDEELPLLVQRQFGAGQSLVELYAANELEFSKGEPAVNIYAAGGEFEPHKDYDALTVLVALTDPDTYSGGGTGLWSREESADELAEPPTVILRPLRGSCLLFGGQVMHTGVQTVEGMRAVFVASFTNRALPKPVGGFGDLFGDQAEWNK
eukprot:1130207-Rhodomonas_salina.3